MSGFLIVNSEVYKGPFDATNRTIRHHLKDTRFSEAMETIEKYIADNINPVDIDVEELSRIYIRYVKVLIKQFDAATLGRVFLK